MEIERSNLPFLINLRKEHMKDVNDLVGGDFSILDPNLFQTTKGLERTFFSIGTVQISSGSTIMILMFK